MAFHEIRFPVDISFGSSGGPERRTEIVTLSNGFEERNTPWADSRRRYEAGFGMRSLDDLEALLAFFEARRGRLHGFRWRDWVDYKSCDPSRAPLALDQVIGVGDGLRRTFQLTKTYRSGEETYTRVIAKPVFGTILAAVARDAQIAEQDFTVDTETGEITFTVPPDIGVQVSAGFEFDVPVRFDTDFISISAAAFDMGEIPEVPVLELRL